MLISAVHQSDSVIHTYIFFFTFLNILVYHRIVNRFPCAVQEDLIAYPVVYNSASILYSHFKVKRGHMGIELEQQAAFEKVKTLVKQIKVLGIS